MVTIHHALGTAYGGVGAPVLTGGVDIFFVISGVMLWTVTARRPVSPGVFLRRRVLRIVPMYWMVTSLMAGLLLAAPGLMRTARFDPAHVAASYLFIPWPHPPPETGIYPLLIPGWTLNYEMAFSALFGLALAAPARTRGAIILGTLAALAAVGLAWPDLPVIPHFYTAPIVLEFALGIAIAMVAARVRAPWLAVGLAVAGWVALAASASVEPAGLERLLRLGVPAAAIVAGTVLWERARGMTLLPAGVLVGNASYAAYLTHTIVLAMLAMAWRRAGLPGQPVAFIVLGVAASLAVALAVHVAFERRLAAWLLR